VCYSQLPSRPGGSLRDAGLCRRFSISGGAHRRRRAFKLFDERSETFRHRFSHFRVAGPERLSNCQQPRSSDQDLRECGWVAHRPFPSRREGGPSHRMANARDPDLRKRLSCRRSKRDGGKGEPHLLSSRPAAPTPRPCVGFLELRRRRCDFFAGWDFKASDASTMEPGAMNCIISTDEWSH
jgi:hypothetical protein